MEHECDYACWTKWLVLVKKGSATDTNMIGYTNV
jgi:hypothetical protein